MTCRAGFDAALSISLRIDKEALIHELAMDQFRADDL